MKKIYILLAAILVCSFTKSNAQIFTHGNVSVQLQPNGSHDTNTCSSQGQMFYVIIKSNSFMGDSVKIKDMSSGAVINTSVNTTGSNPWTSFLPVFNAFGFATDDQVSGGYVFFGGPNNKVISGIDTVYNVTNFFQIPVPNPCIYSTLGGRIYLDYNNDCSFNGSDVPLNGVGVSISETLNSPSMTSVGYGSSSDGSGNYTSNVLKSWMTGATVSIPAYYQFIFPSTTCSPASYSFTSLPQIHADFSLQCTSLIDVQCYAGSNGVVRPNMPFMLHPYVSNTGCNLASGVLKLVLDPNVVYNAGMSTNPATTVVGDTLMWNYVNLTSLSNGAYWNSFMSSIYLTPTTAVTSGDTVCFRIFTNVLAGDVNPANNDYYICLPVVNSYDPNDKEVSPKGTGAQGNIPQATSELTYTIHFQNTGTAPAYNVSITDTLDSDIAINSLRILGVSYNVSPQWLAPNVVKFDFNNIMLPASSFNEPGSHGFIRFSVRLKPALALGTVIQNEARIFFDSNPAIITNTTTNTLANIIGIEELAPKVLVSVYPNPTSDITTFSLQSDNMPISYTFQLMDVLGNIVTTMPDISDSQFTVSRRGLSNGMYFYKIYSAKGIMGMGKLVVQ